VPATLESVITSARHGHQRMAGNAGGLCTLSRSRRRERGSLLGGGIHSSRCGVHAATLCPYAGRPHASNWT
jgi:hypothetical protein